MQRGITIIIIFLHISFSNNNRQIFQLYNTLYICIGSTTRARDEKRIQIKVEPKRDWTYNYYVHLPDINASINSTVLEEGSLAAFKCSGSGTPLPEVHWERKNQILKKSEYNYQISGKNSSHYGGTIDLLLNVPFVTPADTGFYTCVVKNKHGIRKSSIKLHVRGKDRPAKVISKAGKSQYILQESKDLKEFLLPCRAIGAPTPKIEWRILGGENNGQIDESKHRIVEAGLIIKNPKVEDSNIYVCIGKNRHGIDKVAMELTVQKSEPVINTNVTRIEVYPNDFVAVECQIRNRRAFDEQLFWSRKLDASIANRRNNFITKINDIRDKAVLTFPKIQRSDAGLYRCSSGGMEDYSSMDNKDQQIGGGLRMGSMHLSNILEQSVNGKIVEIVVKKVPPIVRILGPRKRSESNQKEIIINCILEQGDPLPNIYWLLNGNRITDLGQNSNYKINSFNNNRQNTLKIYKANRNHSGRYTCQADGPDGFGPEFQDSSYVDLQITNKPVIEIVAKSYEENKASNSKILYEINQNIKIDCSLKAGDGPVSMIWKMGENIIQETKIFDQSPGNYPLFLKNITLANSGTYTCSATNDAGSISKSIDVSVVGLAPNINILRSKLSVINGTKNYEIDCNVDQGNYNDLSVVWSKPDLFGEENELPEFSSQKERKLVFQQVFGNLHGGDYLCAAKNSVGKTAKIITLEVISPPPRPKLFSSEDTIVEPGDSLKLHCDPENEGEQINFNITWYENDQILQEKTENTLILEDLNNTANYKCQFSNLAGNKSMSIEIIVSKKPVIRLSPLQIIAEKGDRVEYTCNIEHRTDNMMIDWYVGNSENSLLKVFKNGTAADAAAATKSASNSTEPSLFDHLDIIENQTKLVIHTENTPHLKTIACEVSNPAGIERKVSKITVLEKLSLEVETGTDMPFPVISENMPLNISCIFTIPKRNVAIFGWYKNGILMPKARSSIFYIKKAKLSDTGVYTCVASQIQLPDVIKTAAMTIQVLNKPILEVLGLEENAIQVKFDKRTPNVRYVDIDSGNSLKYVCSAYDNPNATVTWKREFLDEDKVDSKEVMSTEVITHSRGVGENFGDISSTLEISELTEADSGKYECIGSEMEIEHQGANITSNLNSNLANQNGTYTLKETIFLRVKRWVPHFSVKNGMASYISLPLFEPHWRNRFTLAMGFRPDPLLPGEEEDDESQIKGADGVLLFADSGDEYTPDFIWLGIHRGHVEFRYDLGGGPAKLQSTIKVARGKWNFVRVIRQGRHTMLIVNEREKISGQAPGVHNRLDLSGKISIGGIPPQSISSVNGRIKNEGKNGAGFFGCIKDYIFNNRMVELPNPYTRENRLLAHIEKQRLEDGTEIMRHLVGDKEKAISVNVGSCKSHRKNTQNRKKKRSHGRRVRNL